MTRIAVLAGLLVAVTAPLAAQHSVPLRFAPADGAKLHRLFQSHSRIVVLEGFGATERVIASRELADLGGVTQVALRARDGSRVVHLTFDSLRTRAREGNGPWREVVPDSLERVWLQARVNERLEVLSASTGQHLPGTTTLLELVTGVPDLALPDRPVRAGDRWTDDLAIPVAGLGVAAGASAPQTLHTRALVVVDSLVAREKDTLVYLDVTGSFVSPGDAEPAAQYTGGVSARLVWSTGWRAFVSGATRVRIRARHTAGEGGTERTMVLETTVRQQVRS